MFTTNSTMSGWNAAHAHIAINTFPAIGTALVLLLLAYALLAKSADVLRSALTTFVVTAAMTIVVFTTGGPAVKVVGDIPGVYPPAIGAHQSAANVTVWVVAAAGVAAAILLWQQRRVATVDRKIVAAAIFLLFGVWVLILWTSLLGGRIHHPEAGGVREEIEMPPVSG